MSTTQPDPNGNESLTDRLIRFLDERYHDAIGVLAQHYPQEQRSLVIDYDELYAFDHDLAEDALTKPEELREYCEEALRLYDLPADIDLANAHVRIENLPETETYYPGEFSPTEESGRYRAIRGEISQASDVYSNMTEAAFACRRCGTMSYIPQSDRFQEPHECQGCERQGPFDVNLDQSEFVDAQQLRITTPPEIASGAGTDIDVFVEDDLADVATVGDRVTINGVIHLEQQTNGREKTGKFDPYVEGVSIEVDETDHTDIDCSPEERERIHDVADGVEGDPYDVAAATLAPKIYGYEDIKQMLILAMVSGSKTVYGPDDHDRGEFHVLLLGDPGTAKSKLIERVEQLGWRTVGVSGKGATVAGVTASAVQDDFGDGEASLKAGAFVKAHKGAVCIDELDDMPAEVRAAMLGPMSRQRIHVSKWGINATLRTETAVVAAGNPKYGRFDPYEPVQEQFDLESNLLSRFDLVFTLTDRPDPDEDATIAGHVLDAHDSAKREMRGLEAGAAGDVIETPIERDLLRKWIALAKQQPEPVFASEEVKHELKDGFVDLRGINGYDETDAVPVTFRKLEGILRIAEAAAKFEFSETIEMRHVRLAKEAVGRSMQDFGTDEDGQFDADVQETGTSKSQKQKLKLLSTVVQERRDEGEDGAPIDVVVEALEEEGVDTGYGLIDLAKEKGVAYEPHQGELRWVGGA